MKSAKEKIYVFRSEPNLDRACDEAYAKAIHKFEINEAGHAKDIRFERSRSSLKVRFKEYVHSGSMGGHEHMYIFEAWMEG